MKNTKECKCAICGGWIHYADYGNGDVADKRVYKNGDELAYIELAHRSCAKRADPKQSAWTWDDPADDIAADDMAAWDRHARARGWDG